MYQSTTMQAFIADRGAGLAGFVRGRAEMVSRARTRRDRQISPSWAWLDGVRPEPRRQRGFPPERVSVSGRPDHHASSLEYLRKAPSWQPRGRPIPEEVNEGNFRQWMNIQLQCSESQAEELELDFLTDIWLVVVELDEGLRVGYWSHNPYEC